MPTENRFFFYRLQITTDYQEVGQTPVLSDKPTWSYIDNIEYKRKDQQLASFPVFFFKVSKSGGVYVTDAELFIVILSRVPLFLRWIPQKADPGTRPHVHPKFNSL